MLNRAQVIQQLQQQADSLFVNLDAQVLGIQQLWPTMANDPFFSDRVAAWHGPWIVPTWQGSIDSVFPVGVVCQQEYTIASIDGSQIYPDRHQGTHAFLINIGTTLCRYKTQGSTFTCSSTPHLFVPQPQETEVAVEWVNAKRQELEFQAALDSALQTADTLHALILFDGSLIFWHLEGKVTSWGLEFIQRYIQILHQFYERRWLIAGYISLPRNRELVNLARLWLSDFDHKRADEATRSVEQLLDLHVASFLLPPAHRTTIFANRCSITNHYPPPLKPHFFYLHNGYEIVRIEIPAWIAADETLVDVVAQLSLDQAFKGNGYPVVLAEAHEQAVVKGVDRDFFYQCIAKIGVHERHRIMSSYKSLKKRMVGI